MDDTSAEPEHNSIPIHASLTTTLYSAKEDTDLPTLLMHALDGFQDSGNNEDTMAWNAFDQMEELGLSFGPCETDSHIAEERFVLEDVIPEDRSETPRPMASLRPPFEKWIKSISKKSSRRKRAASDSQILNTYDSHSMHDSQTSYRHRKSNSGSSFGFVTAMKSVSISMASTSIAPRSRATALSSKHQRTDRSSRASHIGPRSSEDSAYTARGVVIDAAVDNRALRRRKVIEEIISTEEGYCGDIKFLMTIYITLLASVPTMSQNMRASINRNLNEIAELHDEILADLHHVVPDSQYSQDDYIRSGPPPNTRGHQRWRSLDIVPEHGGDLSWMHRIRGMTADAHVAADVAKVFGKRMHRFFAYEEYGAKYEMMVKDIASTRQTIPMWNGYQKGLEALSALISSTNLSKAQPKKSNGVGDLLVKPIQRVCKYPLLLQELLKETPVCDCPESHIEIEKVLTRMRETTAQINRATDDPRKKAVLEKTWLLQDRLQCPHQADPRSKSLIRTLGHIDVCGVLHVAWRTKDGVDGGYMVSLLYRDCLVLATVDKPDTVYRVRAMISFADMRVEETDNGRGLQCHTAAHSFKIVFECDHQLFELILSACSPKEELEWRSRLTDRAGREHISGCEQAFFTSASLGIKSMGTVFGKPGTTARRLSIHRATTVGPKSPLCQVIIKNTSALRDGISSSSHAVVNRSQSLLTTNRIPVLAPSRSDRIRLERILADVWTRDKLPYPAMTGRSRGEHLVRSSASSMMRKLSVASITSNFSKRSGSLVSLTSFNRPSEDQPDVPRMPSSSATTVESSVDRLKQDAVQVFVTPLEKTPTAEVGDYLDLHFDEKATSGAPQRRTPTPTLDASLGKITQRIASRKIRNVLQFEGNRKTPPFRSHSDNSLKRPLGDRTTSGGSLGLKCASPGTPGSDRSQCSENQHPTTTQAKWAKVAGLHHLSSAERLGRFF